MKRLAAVLLTLAATSYELDAGTGYELQATSYELAADTSYELRATSYELDAGTGYELRATSYELDAGTGYELQATSDGDEEDSSPERKEKVVNFGLKGGFTSSLFLVNDLTMGYITIDEFQNRYRIGYFASLFMRINFGRHFLQPEVSYSVNRSSLTFTLPEEIGSSTSLTPGAEAFIETDIHSIDIPVLYGWNIIKEHPYQLAIFAGPKLRYIWGKKSKTNFNNLSRQEIDEQLRPFNWDLSLGVAVTIHPIFFDFRYDIGLNNISKRVVYSLPEGSTSTGYEPRVKFDHRDNVLSFSLGIFF
ncbi:MAG: porin family protein [Bacteroides sp.]